jgi:hypothetical protein
MARRGQDRCSDCAKLWWVICYLRLVTDRPEEGSESTLVNGDSASESLASELGPSCQALEDTRNVNIESLYEASEFYRARLMV